jgi:UDP-GlcNAc:undecaprenyl-phosphate GlcNAc-1-phosphate transferase
VRPEGETALEAIRALALAAVASCVSAAAVAALGRFASALGLIDTPGGRKEHGAAIPVVGGIAILLALLAAASLAQIFASIPWFLLALTLVAAVGLWDDRSDIRPSFKLAVQVLAGAVMIWGAGLEIHSVGDLVGWRPIGLWIFIVPMTIFSVAGVANSLNMIDGMDGLAGSIALIAFAWYAAMAWQSGLAPELQTASILCGAIAGFLLFNLRLRRGARARVFLGDAGSLMLGFALGWFAVALTQEEGRTIPPIAVLWVVLLPLADCVSLMARRIRAGRNPFVADRHHIHHYLVARGLSEGQAVAILAAISALFGAVGFAGWRAGVPEPALFWPFFFGFFAYHVWIQRAWKKLEAAQGAAMPALLLDEDQARAPG